VSFECFVVLAVPHPYLCHGPGCRYEVSSGQLVAPRVPGIAERQDMQKLCGTYGKTWHMWQVDRGDPLPYGEQFAAPVLLLSSSSIDA
jgi:hypothetical protein